MDKRRKREQKLADRVARNAAKHEAAQEKDSEGPAPDEEEAAPPEREPEPPGPPSS